MSAHKRVDTCCWLLSDCFASGRSLLRKDLVRWTLATRGIECGTVWRLRHPDSKKNRKQATYTVQIHLKKLDLASLRYSTKVQARRPAVVGNCGELARVYVQHECIVSVLRDHFRSCRVALARRARASRTIRIAPAPARPVPTYAHSIPI